MLDYLIVGQGLAGTLLSYFLEKVGKNILVIDQTDQHAASRVAAGLINPITGRRYVKSWKIDQLIPFAEKTYKSLESELGISIYHSRNIIRTLFNQREENDWLLRTGDPEYEPFMLDQAELGPYTEHTIPAYSYGEVRQSAQVNLPILIDNYRQHLIQEERLKEVIFDFAKLKIEDDHVIYNDIKAKRLIFCEGHKAIHNPFFNYLPFKGAKGEVLIIRTPKVSFEKIIKHRVFLAPIGDGMYWIGSSYKWDYKDQQPTAEGKSFLTDRLNDFLKTPYEIVEHRSAVRPTVKDRRPFLGVHPEFENLFLFNGLGTKGTSLGPFWAKAMQEYLTEDKPLDTAVDIQRFQAEI